MTPEFLGPIELDGVSYDVPVPGLDDYEALADWLEGEYLARIERPAGYAPRRNVAKLRYDAAIRVVGSATPASGYRPSSTAPLTGLESRERLLLIVLRANIPLSNRRAWPRSSTTCGMTQQFRLEQMRLQESVT